MGLYVDYWYMGKSLCETSFCPLINIWNSIPFVIIFLLGVLFGVYLTLHSDNSNKTNKESEKK